MIKEKIEMDQCPVGVLREKDTRVRQQRQKPSNIAKKCQHKCRYRLDVSKQLASE